MRVTVSPHSLSLFDYSHSSGCEAVLRVPGQTLTHGDGMKEEVYYMHRSLAAGGMAHHPGPYGKHQVGQEPEGLGGGNVGKRLFCSFCGKE